MDLRDIHLSHYTYVISWMMNEQDMWNIRGYEGHLHSPINVNNNYTVLCSIADP